MPVLRSGVRPRPQCCGKHFGIGAAIPGYQPLEAHDFSRGSSHMKFLPCKEELGPSLSVLKHQRLVTVIMAVLYILHLRLKDIEVDLTAPNIMEEIHEFY